MSPTVSIEEFLTAQWDELETSTRECVEKDWQASFSSSQVYALRMDGSNRTIAWCTNGYHDDYMNAMHIARHDPAAVLADIAMKRAILTLHLAGQINGHWRCAACINPYPCQTVRLLAAPYAGHPDYRDEWKPQAT